MKHMLMLSEMESVWGGKVLTSPCADALIGAGLDLVVLGFTIGTALVLPIGWAVGISYLGCLVSGVDGMFIFKNCL